MNFKSLKRSTLGHDSSRKNSKRSKCDLPSKTFFSTAIQFRESALPQEFSLPMPIMKYIWSYPSSPEIYQKLIKCCKLFFLKNPILVIDNLQYCDEWKYCTLNECAGRFFCDKKHKHKKINLDGFKDNKIWLAKRLRVETHTGHRRKINVISVLIPKIDCYDIKFLHIHNHVFSYNDLKFLVSGVKECLLEMNIVKYDNGEEVLLEDVIKLFSGAKKVTMSFFYESYNAVCKNYDDFIDACNTVREVFLIRIHRVFSVSKFYQHLKRSKNCSLINISSASDEKILDEIINEILVTESFTFVPPVISCSGAPEWGVYGERLKKMEEIQASEAAKYF